VVFKILYVYDFIVKSPLPPKKHIGSITNCGPDMKMEGLLFIACLSTAAVTETVLLRNH
jgi:hypothetical protein